MKNNNKEKVRLHGPHERIAKSGNILIYYNVVFENGDRKQVTKTRIKERFPMGKRL